ncbi:hypothetical protein H9P43_005467 [Blastocladiella emersonii ATCC 22665]|nr:hypothetical protein H9P43_005467 [Blastocladiella emersonii ATCC 22665]
MSNQSVPSGSVVMVVVAPPTGATAAGPAQVPPVDPYDAFTKLDDPTAASSRPTRLLAAVLAFPAALLAAYLALTLLFYLLLLAAPTAATILLITHLRDRPASTWEWACAKATGFASELPISRDQFMQLMLAVGKVARETEENTHRMQAQHAQVSALNAAIETTQAQIQAAATQVEALVNAIRPPADEGFSAWIEQDITVASAVVAMRRAASRVDDP